MPRRVDQYGERTLESIKEKDRHGQREGDKNISTVCVSLMCVW